ncbi:MAG TPA: hypothetical protein EYH40_04755 [Desulfurococcales archaeon]|nr:hypothetical protein [Desulfurococcales archaeon]
MIGLPNIKSKVKESNIITINFEEEYTQPHVKEKLKFKQYPREVMNILRLGGLIKYLKGRAKGRHVWR